MGNKTILKIENLSLVYDDLLLLENFSLSICRGEMICITGRSGCGKSSLLQALLGFVPLKCGTIYFDNEIINHSSIEIVRSRVSYIPQELSFPFEWVNETVEILFSFAANMGMCVDEELWKVYIELLNLPDDIRNRRFSEISGGQRQRLMLLLTALLKRELVILDEPTSSLDAASVELVLDFLIMLKNRGTTILAVTHDSSFASRCDKVVCL